MPSKALEDFENSLALADALCLLERAYQDPPRSDVSGEVQAVRALRGGAVVLMVAAFERYVKDAIIECVRPLTTIPLRKQFNELPDKMQRQSIKNGLKLAQHGPRYVSLKGGRVEAIRQAARSIADGVVIPEALCHSDNSFDSIGLGEVLGNLGMVDALRTVRPAFDSEWHQAEADTFLQDKLNEIFQSRHRVAHAASVLHITRLDVETDAKFLRAVAKAVDAVMQRHVAAL